MSTHAFRTSLSYNEDNGKTVVRIERKEMERLGIKPGDIVIVEGNRKAAAVCLQLDSQHKEPDDVDIEYVNNSNQSYPIVRMANIVHPSIRSHVTGALVKIYKLMPQEDVTRASTVVLSTARQAENFHGKGYEKRIDFAKYAGNVISKGQMVTIEMTGPDKSRPFNSTVLDVLPESKQGFWLVQPGTKFELRELEDPAAYVEQPLDSNRLVDLKRVVPVVKKIEIDKDYTLILPFVEIYDKGSKLFFYLTERISQVEKIEIGGREITQPASKLSGLVFANMEISDDRGNSYMYAPGGSHGSGITFPVTLPGWEFFNRQTAAYGFWPPIEKGVKELNILVNEFLWWKHPPFPRTAVPPLEKSSSTGSGKTEIREHVMQPMPPIKRGLCVLSGPWEFKVSL